MRLGVVMAGTGAHAAACVGVMKELSRRGITPYAVCGMDMGAWPAALFAAGLDVRDMERALHQASGMGRRMAARTACERLLGQRMPSGVRLNRLLGAQTGERVLSLCPGAALFPCRMTRNGQRVLFSTRAFLQEPGSMLVMQASVAFAARACLAAPPFLSPLQFMGSPLLGEADVAFCVRQLQRLGAHRVLVIAPLLSPRSAPDALDLTAAALRLAAERPMDEEVGTLRIQMPERISAMALDQLEACSEAGRRTAELELDGVFERMGMAFCRVLPFRGQTM